MDDDMEQLDQVEPSAERRATDAAARAEREAFGNIVGRILRSGGFRFDDQTLTRLRRVVWERVAESAGGSARAYLPLLEESDELDRLQRAIAVHDTRFFRNPAQFSLLQDDLLPALWFRRGFSTRLSLWSAGCASGEEAYSLAITALEAALRTNISVVQPATVLATDIDAQAIRIAESGTYGERALANAAPAVRARYFTRSGREWRISEAPRRLVQFERWSLTDDTWPVKPGSIDLVFCHDVLPFFVPDTQQAVLDRFFTALSDGGYLFLSHGESLDHLRSPLEEIQLPSATFYQKVSG
jgi:chemotaxis protein methyltransferase CheR